MDKSTTPLSSVLTGNTDTLLQQWIECQVVALGSRREHASTSQLRDQSQRFLDGLSSAASHGDLDIRGAAYSTLREVLEDVSLERARQGYSPSETATFVFSLKEPLFMRLRERYGKDPQELADAVWAATRLLDGLGLYTAEVYQKGRDQLIVKQQEEMLELSTPVITLWEGILALPLIGTLDSARTQVVMENLLQRIVETGATIAIMDITGVPTVDTLTAQHLLKTVGAARLMGADCIISGIRPQIAQTIVQLGVELGDVVTKATLSDAFAIALRRRGLSVQRRNGTGAPKPTAKQATDEAAAASPED